MAVKVPSVIGPAGPVLSVPVTPTPTPTPNPNVPPNLEIAPRTIPGTPIPLGLIFFSTFDLMTGFGAYGDYAVQPLYMTKELRLKPDTMKTITHSIYMVAAFLPLFGAIIADSWLGKYKSISRPLLLSVVGHIILVLSSIRPLNMEPRLYFLILAMVLRSIASMFIGPCLSPFIGDQFVQGQDLLRSRYYSIDYFLYNALVLVATYVFPVLRGQAGGCFGSQFCYPLAYSVSTVLLVVGTAILYCGRPFYRIVPPSGTVVKNFALCVWIAIKQRFRDRTKREHWLDRADIRFSPEFIDSVKTIFSLAVVFLPMPVYYCLYSQMNTTWTVQSDLLDGRMGGGFEILPDSMDALNMIMVLIFIPFFDYVVYPILGKFGLFKNPLQRMCLGGFFIAFAFLLCGLLNLKIESAYPYKPTPGHADLMLINSLDCDVNVYFQNNPAIPLAKYGYVMRREVLLTDNSFTVVTSSNCPVSSEEKLTLKLASSKAYSVVFAMKPDQNVTMAYAEQRRERNELGNSVMRFIYLNPLPHPNAVLLVKSKFEEDVLKFSDGFTDYTEIIKLTKHDLCWGNTVIQGNTSKTSCVDAKTLASVELYKGAIVDTLLLYDNKTQTASLKMMFAYPEDNIPIMYQFPQYLAITIGEVFLAITSKTFNYSQAPVALRSVVTAMWMFTSSLGHFLVLAFVQIKHSLEIERESTEIFVYASLMALDVLLFAFLSMRYKYKTHVFVES